MGGVRKPFVELEGEPLLAHALRPFLQHPGVVSVVVALGATDAMEAPGWLVELDPRIRVVEGGTSRFESVRRAIAALPEDLDVVAVHDAARPLVTRAVVDRCVEVAAGGEGAVAGSPAVDTMKEVDGEGRVVATPDRSRLWHAHTPQVFPAAVAREAYTGPDGGATDDSVLVERLGLPVRMVDDGAANLKVTVPADLVAAGAILRDRGRSAP
jgi:2-C-methyl-D-erythritol 4-phosphate cytidylyltransferase